MNDIMKKINSLEESGLLIKSVSKTIKMKQKKKKEDFSMLLGIFAASLLENQIAGKRAQQRVKDAKLTCLDETQSKRVEEQLELASIFNVTSSFNKF